MTNITTNETWAHKEDRAMITHEVEHPSGPAHVEIRYTPGKTGIDDRPRFYAVFTDTRELVFPRAFDTHVAAKLVALGINCVGEGHDYPFHVKGFITDYTCVNCGTVARTPTADGWVS